MHGAEGSGKTARKAVLRSWAMNCCLLLQGQYAGQEQMWSTSSLINSQFPNQYVPASVQVGAGWIEEAEKEVGLLCSLPVQHPHAA